MNLSYYITGDIHGSVLDLSCRIKENSIKQGDYLIILGDACFKNRAENSPYFNGEMNRSYIFFGESSAFDLTK